MADTFTLYLQEPEPKDREQSVESYIKARLQSLDRAVAGYTSVPLAGLSGNVDLTPTQAKHRVIVLTGNPSAAVTLRIPHATGANADIVFVNDCGGSFSTVTIKSTGANVVLPGGVPVLAGHTRHVRHSGESAYPVGAAVVTATGLTYTPALTWTNVAAFNNSWSNSAGIYEVASYAKHANGMVYLRGLIAAGVINTVAFQLPIGFRPAKEEFFACESAAAYGRVSVATTGNVTPLTPSSNVAVWLSNVRFQAA